jgi:hypothetical protein
MAAGKELWMRVVGRHKKGLTGLAIAAVLGLAGAGCGGDDDEDDAGGADESQAAKPSRLAIEVSGSAKKPTFSVPESVEGGVVEIELTNSAKGAHGAQLIGADDGHTPQEALKLGNAWGENGKPLPEWVTPAGGVGSIPSGTTASVTQELAPGKYIVVDLDSDANTELEVTGDSGAGDLASDGATIEATEYEFTSTGLKAGKSRVLVDNTGGEPHFIAGIGIKPGSTIADVRTFFRTEKGKPPIDESRSFSTAVIEGGAKQSVQIELEAGKYALLCFVPDRAGGPPHVVKGMISEAEVGP